MAAAFTVAAVIAQEEASAPIGEGVLFSEESAAAAEIITAEPDPAIGVRKARNLLEVEAVSLIGSSGLITASTSQNLLGADIANQFLAFSAQQGRFAAAATPIDSPILLDGIPTWDAGQVLYQVAYPLGTGESVLLHYDVSELLSRRARASGIQPETLQLLALTAVFAALSVAIVIGHRRARTRQDVMERESALLRKHAEELSEANVELAQAKRKAERALELAEEKIRIRSEFVLMINHELRTPLTSVITGAKLLREDGLGYEERRQLLEAMVEDGTRLQEMIDQMLAVARIENRGLSYELTQTSIADLESTLSQVEAEYGYQGRPLEGIGVLTDLNALALVVGSLADNARTHGATRVVVDFGLARGIDPMVEVGERPDLAVYVRISDDGPGIAPSFLPRVFEKFEKSSFSSGTGLGLYMARTIIEALDGAIAVQSSPDGTTFEIALPAIRVRERVPR